MGMTNLDQLQLPKPLLSGLRESRQEAIDQQVITVDVGWWTEALHDHGLPGGVHAHHPETGAVVRYGRAEISRGDLFALAATANESDDAVATLLWSSLAWGAGTSARNMTRRMTSLAADWPHSAKVLRHAAELSRSEPQAAYDTLRPNGRTAFPWLGPAFFSKYLYFAGGGDLRHPCFILDTRVATSLVALGWESLHPEGGWPASTYERYCCLLNRWARDASKVAGRQVGADEIERWLFDRAGNMTTT